MRHLSEEELIDLAEGTRSVETMPPHLAACDSCRRQVADLRALMSVAADVEVPEPSPLFWDHLSARVHDGVAAVDQERLARSRWAAAWMSWRIVVPAAALAVVVLAAVVSLRTPVPGIPVGPAVTADDTHPETDAAVSLVDDASLGLIADLASDLDWDAAAEAGLTTGTGALDRVLFYMSADERLELQRILKQELSGQGA